MDEKCLIASVTTDGAKNEKKAGIKLVGDRGWLHCACHNVQLAVRDVLTKEKYNWESGSIVLDTVSRIHGVTNTVMVSPTIKADLRKIIDERNEGKNGPKTLCSNVPTRWDSDLAMMERFILLHDGVATLFEKYGTRDTISERGVQVAGAIVRILKPVRLFSKQCQINGRPTLCHLARWIDQMLNGIISAFEGLSGEIREDVAGLVDNICKRIKYRFQSTFRDGSLALIAALLSPVDANLDFDNFPMTSEAKELVRDELFAEYREFCADAKPEVVERGKMLLVSFLDEAKRSEAMDPLEFWRERLDELSVLVKGFISMLLSIPVSSAENERTFSMLRIILGYARRNMSDTGLIMESSVKRFLNKPFQNYPSKSTEAILGNLECLLSDAVDKSG